MSKRQIIAKKKRYMVAVAVLPLAMLFSVPKGRAQIGNAISSFTSSKDFQQGLNTFNDVQDGISDVKNLFNSAKNLFSSFNPANIFNLGRTALNLKSIDNLPPEVEAIFGGGDKGRDEIQDEIEEGVMNGSVVGSPTASNAANELQELARKSDRTSTNIQAQSILSKQGQEDQKREIDEIGALIDQVQGLAADGQSDTVTQDVMKRLLIMQAQQTQVLGQTRADALESRIDAQYTNINLANISETLDSMATTDRDIAASTASTALELSIISGQQ